MGSVPFDTPATIDKASALVGQAASGGAQLVVFPEAFVGCYPKGADFGALVGFRSPEGRRWFRRYAESAIEVPGPETAQLGKVAREHRVHLVIGVIERGGGTLYCTILFFSPEGELLAKHRKLMPTAMERLIWGFGDGSTLPVLATPIGKLGAVICWENYMPLLRMAMYSKGIELYCAPTVDDRDAWFPAMRHIAWEGRCFVLSACQFFRRDAYPPGFPVALNVDDGVLIRGGSVIVSPLGRVVAGPHYGEETILRAELDLGEITEGKYDLDVAGHYARPDIFRLTVDERPKPPVSTAPPEP